ncbi:hypothetical protein Q7S_14115 [Rahnella aquatilis HX2]|nr:hypothetical protein Q7S_14115 [Rahnella aquatilis HX2]
MADIFSGNEFSFSYNEDTGNRLPKAISNIEIDELAAFPVLAISSSTTAVETYDSEYQTKLLSEQDVQPIAIVVNYIPDNSTHEFLDEATDKSTEFQLVLTYNSDEATSQVFYAIVNGVITGESVSGDQNSVLTKTYSFQPTELVTRSTSQVVGAPLSQGDYGVGSNTTIIPQYETDTPSGNAFIKVPAATPSNPAGTDLMGIGMVDATDTSALVTTKTGALNVYAKNQTTAWTRIYTVTQSDSTYVPLTRTVNGHALNANVVVTKADVGLGTVTDNPQLKIASNLSDLANVVTARTNLGLGTAAVQNIGTTGSVIPLLSTANTWSGVQTFIGRTFITNLASTTAGSYNGTSNVSLGVAGVLPLANGGTGGSTAALARTSLGLGTVATVNIGTSGATIPLLSTANTWSGVQTFNTPIAITSGGTGAGTATDALINLGALPLSGGVITGKTTVNNNIHVVTQTGNAAAVTAGTEVDVFYAGTNSLALGDTKQKTLIRGNGLLSHGNEVATYDVYTTGNKPSANDVGALPITGGTLTGALVGTTLSLATALPVSSGGTGNTTGTVAALTTARTFVTNLASTTAVSFNGTANNSHGVTGILPIGNGGNGNAIGLAASATVLATARTFVTDLTSTTAGSFNGSSNVTQGVSGILPLANGGIGNDTGTAVNVSGIVALANGGTGASTAAAARTTLGVAYGAAAGTVAQGNDTRLNTVDGKTGGTVIGTVSITAGSTLGVAPWQTTSNNYIRLGNTSSDSTSGNFVNSIAGGYYTGNWSLGGVRGSGTDLLSVQLNVLSTSGGSSAGFSFFPNGRVQASSYIHLGGRVVGYTAVNSTYLEVSVDGSAKGINFFDSDLTLKENVIDANGQKSLDIIENIRPVSYKFKDYTYKVTEKDEEGNDVEVERIQKGDAHQFGVIAQEFEQLLPEGVRTSSDGKKSLDPLEVLGLLLTTCHEQQKMIRQLQDDVKSLKE